MSHYFLLLLALLLPTNHHCRHWDWDNIDYEVYCIEGHEDNTPCATKCKIGANCTEPVSNFVPLTTHEKQVLLDLHNELREKTARGDLIEYNFPPGTNINALNYDDQCEFMTTCWIRQCNFWHDQHFKPDGSKFGQNLHMRATAGHFDKQDDPFLRFGVMNWFNEYKMLKAYPDMYKAYHKVSGTGHFTALIWHRTTLMGCAKNIFRRDGKEYYFLFCNYYPSPNYPGAAIYDTAPNSCKRGTRYPHLCGDVKELEKTKRKSSLANQSAKGLILALIMPLISFIV